MVTAGGQPVGPAGAAVPRLQPRDRGFLRHRRRPHHRALHARADGVGVGARRHAAAGGGCAAAGWGGQRVHRHGARRWRPCRAWTGPAGRSGALGPGRASPSRPRDNRRPSPPSRMPWPRCSRWTRRVCWSTRSWSTSRATRGFSGSRRCARSSTSPNAACSGSPRDGSGCTPKWLVQRRRLHEAAGRLSSAEPPDLARVAARPRLRRPGPLHPRLPHRHRAHPGGVRGRAA